MAGGWAGVWKVLSHWYTVCYSKPGIFVSLAYVSEPLHLRELACQVFCWRENRFAFNCKVEYSGAVRTYILGSRIVTIYSVYWLIQLTVTQFFQVPGRLWWFLYGFSLWQCALFCTDFSHSVGGIHTFLICMCTIHSLFAVACFYTRETKGLIYMSH